jgi:DNA-binding transcriptional LysR family regulator
VTMTSYGSSLYPAIRAVLNSDEALQQSIARLNGLEKGKVKLGTFNSVCAYMLPDLLKSFKNQYPQIEVEVYQGTYDDVKEWLRSGQVDIGFLSFSCAEEFDLTPILREPLMCIVPKDWEQPVNGVMTPEMMHDRSFVVQGDATDADVRSFLKKYKIGTYRRCHVIDDMSNIAMVEAGVGMAIMPQLALKKCTAAVNIYPIDPPEYREVGITVPRATAMAPAVEQMFRHIVDSCKDMPK